MTKGIWVCLAGLLVAAMPSQSLCDEEYPTNLDLVERAVRIAADSMDIRPPAGTDGHPLGPGKR